MNTQVNHRRGGTGRASLSTPAARLRGFTLVEVLIAMAIVGILSAFAIPSYFEYIQRANRAEARAALMDASQYMQQFYSINNSYKLKRDGTTPVALPESLTRSPKTGAARYTISLVESKLTRHAYELQAVPVSKDPCGTFLLNNAGLRSLKGNNVKDGFTLNKCWR